VLWWRVPGQDCAELALGRSFHGSQIISELLA
jgi:hypothetical protein